MLRAHACHKIARPARRPALLCAAAGQDAEGLNRAAALRQLLARPGILLVSMCGSAAGGGAPAHIRGLVSVAGGIRHGCKAPWQAAVLDSVCLPPPPTFACRPSARTFTPPRRPLSRRARQHTTESLPAWWSALDLTLPS